MSLGSTRDEYGNVEDVCSVVHGANNFTYYNLPGALANRMRRIKRRNKAIHCVRLFERGGYFIRDDEGEDWGGLQSGVANELAKAGRVLDVAIARNGSWVVIRDDHFSSSPGVTADLVNYLNTFYTRQKARNESRALEIAEYIADVQREIIRLAGEAREAERLRQEAERAAAEARERQRLDAETADLVDALRPTIAELSQAWVDVENRKAMVARLTESIQSHLDPLSPRARAHVEGKLGWDERIALAPSPLGASRGGESASSASAPCVICTDSPAIRALVPCGHLCLCDGCSAQFFFGSTSRACPLCRERVTSTLRIYRQD